MSSRPRCTHRCGRAFPRSSRSSSPSERWCGCRTRSRTSAWRGPSARSCSAAFSANASTETSERRWRELARTAERAVVLADFPRAPGDRRPGRSRSRSRRRIRSPASGRSCASRRASARAWRAGSGRETTATAATRMFEAMWTVEAPAVRLAAQVCLRLTSAAMPDLREDLHERLDATPVAREHELRSAVQISTRMVQVRRRLIAARSRRRGALPRSRPTAPRALRVVAPRCGPIR